MKNKTRLLLLILGLILNSMPVYSVGYEGIKTWGQFFLRIVIFIAVIFLAVIGTRIIAINYNGIKKQGYIELYDVKDLPGGNKIVIVKINKIYYILSINSGQTTVMDRIKEEDFIEIDFNGPTSNEFNKYNNKIYNYVEKIVGKVSNNKHMEGKEEDNEK